MQSAGHVSTKETTPTGRKTAEMGRQQAKPRRLGHHSIKGPRQSNTGTTDTPKRDYVNPSTANPG